MGTTVKLPLRARVAQAVLVALRRALPKRASKTRYGGPTAPDEDGGLAGVREPRRPRPDLPSLSAEEPVP